MPSPTQTDPETTPSPRTAFRRTARDAAVAGAGLVVVVTLMLIAYTAGFGHPRPHDIPVAVVGPPQAVAQLDASPALEAHAASDLGAARAMVHQRQVYGALDLSHPGQLGVETANGAGHSVAAALQGIGAELGARQHLRVTQAELAPTSPEDPGGTVEFYCVVFLAVGGALGASILAKVHGPVGSRQHVRERIGILVAYAAAAAGAFTLVVDVGFGALTGHAGWLFLALWGFTTAVALAASGVASLFGPVSGIVLTLLFTVVGNPSAGGAVGRPLLDPFFSAMDPVFPHAGGLSIVRGALYFDGNGIGAGVLCLTIWGVAGASLLWVSAFWHDRQAARAQPVPAAPQVAVLA